MTDKELDTLKEQIQKDYEKRIKKLHKISIRNLIKKARVMTMDDLIDQDSLFELQDVLEVLENKYVDQLRTQTALKTLNLK